MNIYLIEANRSSSGHFKKMKVVANIVSDTIPQENQTIYLQPDTQFVVMKIYSFHHIDLRIACVGYTLKDKTVKKDMELMSKTINDYNSAPKLG